MGRLSGKRYYLLIMDRHVKGDYHNGIAMCFERLARARQGSAGQAPGSCEGKTTFRPTQLAHLRNCVLLTNCCHRPRDKVAHQMWGRGEVKRKRRENFRVYDREASVVIVCRAK